MKAKVLLLYFQHSPNPKPYLLTAYHEKDCVISGHVENGFWDMKVKDGVFYCISNETVVHAFKFQSFIVVDVDYDGGDYNTPINKALDALER